MAHVSQSEFQLRKRLTNGSNGGSMTEETNRVIADNLVKNIEQLLDGTARYYTCCDKNTEHKKIVIEYNHKQK
jgi:hypothetical protein